MRESRDLRRYALLVGALVASLLPGFPVHAQQAGPQIEFLNPSGYTASLEISDKADQDGAVHLVAWVGPVPANPFVEFEITSTTAGTTTVEADRAGTDTWEAFLQVAHLSDGQYTLRAILYEGFTGPGTGDDVDVVERVVTLNRSDMFPPPASNTVEITYPANAGPWGVHTPKGSNAIGIIDTVASTGTDQIRVLYTTSAPGTAPEWTPCGSGRVVEGFARARCTLAEGVSGPQVRAVAAVANETPFPATPSEIADATGDAHRVDPYAQVPRFVEVTPDAIIVDPSTDQTPTCPQFIVSVLDDRSRAVAGANVDVHVTGPDDQIRFGWVQNQTDPFQAPNDGHVSTRPGVDCADGTNERNQGDHNIPGADDPQHIESVSGTRNDGTFVFALRSTTVGGSRIVAWADTNDDDQQQVSEASGGARLGWGQPPPESERQLFLEPTSGTKTTGACHRMVLAIRRDGNPESGANVDVHASGPGTGVAFCDPGDGSASGRAPDQGHIGEADDEDTRHREGETDATGEFVFGVTAASEGTTEVVGWIDSDFDDAQSIGELFRSAAISWTISGERDISISSNRSRVRKGRRVRISGGIDGSATCEADQLVRLRAKPVSGGRFKTIKKKRTAVDGDYSFRVRVRKSKRYFVVTPRNGACEKARSRRITVRARG